MLSRVLKMKGQSFMYYHELCHVAWQTRYEIRYRVWAQHLSRMRKFAILELFSPTYLDAREYRNEAKTDEDDEFTHLHL